MDFKEYLLLESEEEQDKPKSNNKPKLISPEEFKRKAARRVLAQRLKMLRQERKNINNAVSEGCGLHKKKERLKAMIRKALLPRQDEGIKKAIKKVGSFLNNKLGIVASPEESEEYAAVDAQIDQDAKKAKAIKSLGKSGKTPAQAEVIIAQQARNEAEAKRKKSAHMSRSHRPKGTDRTPWKAALRRDSNPDKTLYGEDKTPVNREKEDLKGFSNNPSSSSKSNMSPGHKERLAAITQRIAQGENPDDKTGGKAKAKTRTSIKRGNIV